MYKTIRINDSDLVSDTDIVEEVDPIPSVMPTHELLDRFEILFPDVTSIGDLRRIVVDQDLSSIFKLNDNEELRKAVVEENFHSIFRLLENYPIVNGNIEDLRKVVLEKNLYSLFRLFPTTNEDLNLYRKAIVNKNIRSIFKLLDNKDMLKATLNDNQWKLWPILENYLDTQFIPAFKNIVRNKLDFNKDSFSRGQIQSKLWLVQELEKLDVELGTVFLCAGWYATLATMLFESDIKVNKIRSFDIDDTCIDIAETFNKPWFVDGWKFKSITQNIMDIDYNSHTWQCWSNANNRMSKPISDSPDTIINTSCEHITNFEEWYAKIPDGKLVVLQSNNYCEVEEHVNTHNTLKSFSDSTPMGEVLYEGGLELPQYTRFMKIGYR